MDDDGVEYFTSTDIATHFEVEVNTVNQWVSRKLITPARKVQIGRFTHNLFTREAVTAFAQKKYGYTP